MRFTIGAPAARLLAVTALSAALVAACNGGAAPTSVPTAAPAAATAAPAAGTSAPAPAASKAPAPAGTAGDDPYSY